MSTGLHIYKNDFRWQVMPGDAAMAANYFMRSFGNKAKAVAYQREVKKAFPDEPCSLCDTGKYYNLSGRIYYSRPS